LFHGKTLRPEVCAEQQPAIKLAIKISWTNIVIAQIEELSCIDDATAMPTHAGYPVAFSMTRFTIDVGFGIVASSST
jgi:hypothetical protein